MGAIRLSPLLVGFTALFAACAQDAGAPEATATPGPTETATPAPTAFPTFTPTPDIGAGSAIVVGGDLRVRAAPTTQSEVLYELEDNAPVTIAEAVRGENWLVGGQTWVPVVPDWTATWFRLTDGTYLYAAFVFILQPGETSPLGNFGGEEKWINVNTRTQTATAMVGDTPVYVAPVSTGSPDFPSPPGTHRIEPDGRVVVERMTASQAGYASNQARYDVERVLFTQYFDRTGNALHLNYWRPREVFGSTATSHGCVGMQLHDAQWFWLFAGPGTRVEIHG